MADTKVRAAVVRVQSRRVGKAEEAELNVTANGKPLIGLDGVEGFSEGAVMSKLTIKTFEPVDGRPPDMMTLTVGQTQVKATFLYGGKEWTITGARCLDATVSSVSETGECNGNFVFQGGKPFST